MTGPALLGALLAAGLPGLRAIDLTPRLTLLPFLPGCRAALAAPPDDPAEAALLAGFAPLIGLDPIADSALLAGAPDAWGPGPRLLATTAPLPPAWSRLAAEGALILAPSAPDGAAHLALLLETPAGLARHALLAPEQALPGLLASLAAAARQRGWRAGAQQPSPRLASLALLGPAVLAHPPGFRRTLAELPQAGPPGQRRVLLGSLPHHPWRLTLRLAGPPPRLFADGIRLATSVEAGRLTAEFLPPPDRPTILGLAGTLPETLEGTPA
jgi:hypothetical protein